MPKGRALKNDIRESVTKTINKISEKIILQVLEQLFLQNHFMLNTIKEFCITNTCSKSIIEVLKKLLNAFKVNKNYTRTISLTSFRCLYWWLWRYFLPFPSVSNVNFEHVNVSCVPDYDKKRRNFKVNYFDHISKSQNVHLIKDKRLTKDVCLQPTFLF